MNKKYEKEESIIDDEIFIQDVKNQRINQSRQDSNISNTRNMSNVPSLMASMALPYEKNEQEAFSSLHPHQKPLITYKIEHQAVEDYKKTIRLRIFAVIAIVFLLLFGKIFANLGTQEETDWIVQFQELVGVDTQPSWYAKLFSYIGYSQNFDILLVSHFYVSFFFLYKPVFCVKVIVVHITSTSIVPLLQILFANPRPFWVSSDIYSIDCPNAYPYPSLTAFTLPYLFLYAGYVITDEEDNPKYQRIFIGITVVIYLYITLTETYAGFLYLYQILLSLFYTILYYYVTLIYDKTIDKIVERSTVDIREAKRYTINWLIFVIIFAFICICVYSSADQYLNPEWIENFYQCLINNDLLSEIDGVPSNHVLGPWPSFINTSTIFIVIGAIFGTAKTFRDLKGLIWYDSEKPKRFKMAIIANLCLIPSWFYFLYLYQAQGLVKSGILAYLTNAVHYVVVYYFIFGVLPKHVFHRLEWTNRLSSIIH